MTIGRGAGHRPPRVATLLLAAGLALAAPAAARTLRWSAQGDASTLDPHAESELFTNAVNQMRYDALVRYDKAGVARRIDEHTVEFTTPVPNPAMAATVANILVMSRAWCEKHGATRTQDFVHHRPIVNAATRMAALYSGEVDFVLDPPCRTCPGSRATPP